MNWRRYKSFDADGSHHTVGRMGQDHAAVYYKGERGNKPYELDLMLRLYALQNLYNLSDDGTVAEAMDS